MCKIPAEIRLAYIDKILGEAERGLCSPDDALVRISVWARDSEEEVALLDNGDTFDSNGRI